MGMGGGFGRGIVVVWGGGIVKWGWNGDRRM